MFIITILLAKNLLLETHGIILTMTYSELKSRLATIKELADKQKTLTSLETLFLNFSECVLEMNATQRAEIQTLKNEINKLGLIAKPHYFFC